MPPPSVLHHQHHLPALQRADVPLDLRQLPLHGLLAQLLGRRVGGQRQALQGWGPRQWGAEPSSVCGQRQALTGGRGSGGNRAKVRVQQGSCGETVTQYKAVTTGPCAKLNECCAQGNARGPRGVIALPLPWPKPQLNAPSAHLCCTCLHLVVVCFGCQGPGCPAITLQCALRSHPHLAGRAVHAVTTPGCCAWALQRTVVLPLPCHVPYQAHVVDAPVFPYQCPGGLVVRPLPALSGEPACPPSATRCDPRLTT